MIGRRTPRNAARSVEIKIKGQLDLERRDTSRTRAELQKDKGKTRTPKAESEDDDTEKLPLLISAYEQLRDGNVKRNLLILQSLGLATAPS